MLSIRCTRWTIAGFALAALFAPGLVSAQTPDHPSDNSTAQFPTSHDLKSLTTSGSYLAARHASVERDAASAAAFPVPMRSSSSGPAADELDASTSISQASCLSGMSISTVVPGPASAQAIVPRICRTTISTRLRPKPAGFGAAAYTDLRTDRFSGPLVEQPAMIDVSGAAEVASIQ